MPSDWHGNKDNSCFVRLLGRFKFHNLILFVNFCRRLSWISISRHLSIPESRLVKLPIPVSRSQFQSRLTLPFHSQIPDPGFKISQIPHPEKPIRDPVNSHQWERLHAQTKTRCLRLVHGTACLPEKFLAVLIIIPLYYLELEKQNTSANSAPGFCFMYKTAGCPFK